MLNKVLNSGIFVKKNIKFFSKGLSSNETEKKIIDSFKSTFNTLKENENNNTLKDKLSQEQQTKVEMLVDKYMSLSEFQAQLYKVLTQEKLAESKKFTPMQIQTDWLKVIKLEDKISDVNKTYFEQQEFMAKLTDWLSKQPKPDLGLGFAVAAPQAKVEEKKEAPKEEEKKEKAQYDIELTSFDAAKKIGLIKEVRAYTSLGLKESKDLVEKAPTVILRGVKKEDTEAIIKKLTDAGAKITLI